MLPSHLAVLFIGSHKTELNVDIHHIELYAINYVSMICAFVSLLKLKQWYCLHIEIKYRFPDKKTL